MALAIAVATAIAMATPPLWTTWRPRWLPWYLESYVNGVHTFGVPQAWLFPIFPWTAFAFAGLAAGFVLFSEWPAKDRGARRPRFSALRASRLFYLASWLDKLPPHLRRRTIIWHTSPNFFLARVGVLLVIAWSVTRGAVGDWARSDSAH